MARLSLSNTNCGKDIGNNIHYSDTFSDPNRSDKEKIQPQPRPQPQPTSSKAVEDKVNEELMKARKKAELIITEVWNAVETQDTDQDSTVLHPSFSARNVTNMDISPASASQNHRAQM